MVFVSLFYVNGLYRDTDCTATIDFPRQMLSESFVAEQSAQQTEAERKFILTKHILYRECLFVCATFITLELARIRLVLVSHKDIEYGIFRGKVLNFDQSKRESKALPHLIG